MESKTHFLSGENIFKDSAKMLYNPMFCVRLSDSQPYGNQLIRSDKIVRNQTLISCGDAADMLIHVERPTD